MNRLLLRTKARLRDATKPIGEAAVGTLTVGMLRATRYFDPIKTANLFGRITRSIGPMMREQRIGRANLTAAFPEKSPEEIETILAGVWDNLGRVGAEFAHLDHIWEHDPARPEDSRIEIQTRTHELFAQLRLDGKPALIFASHLGMRRPCKTASTSPCWSISILPMASRSRSSAARPGPIRCWRGCCGRSSVRFTASASSACPAIASAPNYPKK